MPSGHPAALIESVMSIMRSGPFAFAMRRIIGSERCTPSQIISTNTSSASKPPVTIDGRRWWIGIIALQKWVRCVMPAARARSNVS